MKEYWPPCNNLSNTGVLHPSAKPPCNGDACSLCSYAFRDATVQQIQSHFESEMLYEINREVERLLREEQSEQLELDIWETHQ